jgi:phosphoglycerol transferase MdoB-like AlkP superfamily enzyme
MHPRHSECKQFSNRITRRILAGIPNFYHEPFTTSPYGRNTIDGLGTLLLPYGYRTSFFHGGENGTMNFNVLTKNAGFEKYLGKNEYPNKNDDDGTWGIYDEPFLLVCRRSFK